MTAPASINSAARRAYAQLLRQFISGRMTNFEYESRFYKVYNTYGDDRGVSAVYDAASHLYCDFTRHRMTDANRALTPEFRRTIARWVLFLRTNELPSDDIGVNESSSPTGACLLLVFGTFFSLVTFLYAVGGGPASLTLFLGAAAAWSIFTGLGVLLRPQRPPETARSPAYEHADSSCWPFPDTASFERARGSQTYFRGR